MPIQDDGQFEKYLKQFHPVTPEPLTVKEQAPVRRRPLVLAAWAAVAAAVILAAVMLAMRSYQRPSPKEVAGADGTALELMNNSQPLTIRSASELLARAPSFQAAVESVAFQTGSVPVAEGKHSALALLSKEKIKL